MHSRTRTFAGAIGSAAASCFIILGCVTNAANGDGDGGGGGGSCGQVQLSGDTWGAKCQDWLNQYCCNELLACNSDIGCAQLLACENDCPTPRTDTCTFTCKGQSPTASIDTLDALGACSKTTPSDGTAIPSGCEWP